MAAKYARQFTLPEGFATLLKDFTREVLRADPEDIHKFGHDYFSEAIQRRNNPDEYMEEPERPTTEQLMEIIGNWFAEADVDGNGVLDRKEFKNVFVGLKEELKLTDIDVLKIMSEADENQDGQVEYTEFLPLAVDVVNSLYAKRDFEEEALATEEDFLLHGMDQEELEALLQTIFTQADKDGNGWLNRKEFSECIKDADLGFTKKEINLLLTEVDVDNDGKVSYEEFVPLCVTLLEMVSSSFSEVPQRKEELHAFFVDLFSTAAGEDGKLSHTDVIKLVKEADLGLTRVQIHAIMSEAEEDEEGRIDYEQIADAMSGMVLSLVNVSMQKGRATKHKAVCSQEGYDKVLGYSSSEIESNIMSACVAADTAGSGFLPRTDIKMAINNIMPEMPQKHLQAVMSIATPNDEGLCDYSDVAKGAFKVIQFLQLNDQIS